MNLARFLNALRILRNINRYELEDAGIVPPFVIGSNRNADVPWVNFREDPFYFLMHCDDTMAAKIWTIVESRQPVPKPPHADAAT